MELDCRRFYSINLVARNYLALPWYVYKKSGKFQYSQNLVGSFRNSAYPTHNLSPVIIIHEQWVNNHGKVNTAINYILWINIQSPFWQEPVVSISHPFQSWFCLDLVWPPHHQISVLVDKYYFFSWWNIKIKSDKIFCVPSSYKGNP